MEKQNKSIIKMRKSFNKIFNILLVLVLLLSICGCTEKTDNNEDKKDDNDNKQETYVETQICPYCKKCNNSECTHCEEKCTCEPVQVSVESFKILADTAYETMAYKYTTNKEGPTIAIVGGIHGDELAGWNAGLQLVEKIKTEVGVRGTILLIPQANILADNAKHRYQVSGYDFSDLNRSFPLDRYSTAKEETIKISTAIKDAVEAVDPDYIIDLHESYHSWVNMEVGETRTLGDTLIANNNSRFMRQLIRHYNENYKLEGENDFRQESANQKGSFNYYFTNTYPDKTVFTVETNRNEDRNALDTRVRQQLNVLEALFDLAWDRK